MRQQLCLKNLAVHIFAPTYSNAGEVWLFQVASIVSLIQGGAGSSEPKRSLMEYRYIFANVIDICQ
jgi:hypothetical protein